MGKKDLLILLSPPPCAPPKVQADARLLGIQHSEDNLILLRTVQTCPERASNFRGCPTPAGAPALTLKVALEAPGKFHQASKSSSCLQRPLLSTHLLPPVPGWSFSCCRWVRCCWHLGVSSGLCPAPLSVAPLHPQLQSHTTRRSVLPKHKPGVDCAMQDLD